MSGSAHDHWLAGGHLEGVRFGLDEAVVVRIGEHTGRPGRVAALQALAPEPLYLVALASGEGDVGILQSGLEPAPRAAEG